MTGADQESRAAGRSRRRAGWHLLVELLERRRLLSTYMVTSSLDSGPNTLRWAIEQVNGDRAPDVIRFNIGMGGVATISLQTPLPAITNSVVLDGSSQPGSSTGPKVVINGQGLPAGSDGLVVSASGSTIENLSIVGFLGTGLVLSSVSGVVAAGNWLGVLPSGTAEGNGQGLLLTASSSNTIGGSSGAAGNVISGNSGPGVTIDAGTTDSTANLLTANLIGVAPSGMSALGNSAGGVVIDDATLNQIGGPGIGLGNVISGNVGPGLELESGAAGTLILGNTIGAAIDGKSPLGNSGDGILIEDSLGVTIGGTETGDGNVIAANQGNGVEVKGSSGGMVALGNFVGTDLTAMQNLGNRFNGFSVGSSAVTIGGSTTGAGNTIEFNGQGSSGAGIQLEGEVDHDTFLSNSIYENAGLGINLGSGPTPNHAPGTAGPNDFQNYPVLSSGQADGTVTYIKGTLTESPNSTYLVQIFSSPTADPSSFGQGKTLVDQIQVTTDDSGNGSFTASGLATSPGSYLAATATSLAGDTSEFSQDIQVQGEIDLRVSGSAAPSPVLSGDKATFTITVVNDGSASAHQVVLTDLPPGLSVLSATASQGFVQPGSGGALVAELGTILPDGSASLTIVVQTAPGSSGTISDSASVTSQEDDPFPNDESTTVTDQVVAATDLSATLAAAPSTAPIGSPVTYTLTVTNNGPSDAPSAAATLPITPGMSFVSASTTLGSVNSAPGSVTALFGDMASGTSATVTILLEANQLGTITETGTASSSDVNTDPSGGQASASVTIVPAAALATVVTASAPQVLIGSNLIYQVTVTNNGPDDAQGVVISDTLPNSATYLTAVSNQSATPSESNGVVSLDVPSLATGASAVLTITIQAGGTPGATLANTVTATSSTLNPAPSDATASVSTTVVGQSDLGLSAADSPSSAYSGETIIYRLTATNSGPYTEPDAVVSAMLPAGLALASSTTTQGSLPTLSPQGLLSADLGAIPSGTTATLTLSLVPGPTNVGTIPITFAIQGENLDPNPANNTAATSINVAAAAALAVQIPAPAPAFDQVDYTYDVVVTNPGPNEATNVTTTIPLPAGVQFVSASATAGTAELANPGAVVAAIANLAAGSSATISVAVLPLATGNLDLAASTTADQFNPLPAGESAAASTTIAPSIKLVTTLLATPATQLTGKPMTFVATVANTGPDPSSSVVLTLPIAPGYSYTGSAASSGSTQLEPGQFVASLGALASGASATVTLVLTPTVPGAMLETAVASAPEHDPNPALASASASATAVESAGIISLNTNAYAVTEFAGMAYLTVLRSAGTAGAITVPFWTTPLNATPGLDYTPVSGSLAFAPGQTSATIAVPVLPNPWDNHDEWLSVSLGAPTGGAWLGPISSAPLRIIDLDPNTTPPQLTSLTWTGSAQAITSLNLAFTAPLDPMFANYSPNYVLTTSSGQWIPVAANYNAWTHAVTLTPSVWLPSGQTFDLRVVGSGPSAIRDIAGNLLAGAAPGAPGTDYWAAFEQGRRLQYIDEIHNRVTIAVKGPGYLEQVRSLTGASQVVTIVGIVPRRTVLAGNVHALRGGTGRTDLGIVSGLGNFGEIKVALKSPPFFVRQFPFFRRGRGIF